MNSIIDTLAPNLAAYKSRFYTSIEATGQMFLLAGLIVFVLGLFFGIVLVITEDEGICRNKTVHTGLTFFVNFFRSIPFVILLIFLIPLTRFLVGTSIGVKGAVVPLCFGAVPFYTRQVEAALHNVQPGKIEAARSMGSGTAGLIFRVYLHEAVPELLRVTTITAVSLIGLTTMAGAVGAGGIGSFAINYGQNQNHQDIVNVCVILLVVLTTLLQMLGNYLAKKTTNRQLWKKGSK